MLLQSRLLLLIAGMLISLSASAQQPVAAGKGKEINYLLYNRPVWHELYQLNKAVKSIQETVTDFQSVAAVTASDKTHTYIISIAFDAKKKTITEISDENKPSFRIRKVYLYDNNNKIKRLIISDDNIDGKGWQLNEEKIYSYSKDKNGNFYDEVIQSTDPRPGSAAPAPRKVKALYNDKNQLVKCVEGIVTFEYSYNEHGDISLQKVDGGDVDSRGQFAYKYAYDAQGNWIRKETYETTAYKDNLLLERSVRKIVY